MAIRSNSRSTCLSKSSSSPIGRSGMLIRVMSVAATMATRRSISRTLSRYCSNAARSAAPSSLWNDFERSRIRSSRLSDSRALRTRSLGVVAPNSVLKTFFGLHRQRRGVAERQRDRRRRAVAGRLLHRGFRRHLERRQRRLLPDLPGDDLIDRRGRRAAIQPGPGLRTCTDPALAAFSRLPMVDTYRLNGSSGCVIAFSL